MTAVETLQKFRAIAERDNNKDTERCHTAAEETLLEFMKNHDPACKDVAEAYEKMRDDCGFWYA